MFPVTHQLLLFHISHWLPTFKSVFRNARQQVISACSNWSIVRHTRGHFNASRPPTKTGLTLLQQVPALNIQCRHFVSGGDFAGPLCRSDSDSEPFHLRHTLPISTHFPATASSNIEEGPLSSATKGAFERVGRSFYTFRETSSSLTFPEWPFVQCKRRCQSWIVHVNGNVFLPISLVIGGWS